MTTYYRIFIPTNITLPIAIQNMDLIKDKDMRR